MPITYDYNTGKPLGPGEKQSVYNIKTGEKIGAPSAAAPAAAPAPITTPTPLPGASTSSFGNLTNLRLALRAALDESTARKSDARIRAVSPLMEGGAAPSVITAAMGLARQGLQQSANETFKNVMEGVNEEQRLAAERRKESQTLLKLFSDNGTLADMPDMALLELSKSAGLSEGQALAWKARITEINKMEDEKAALEIKKLNADIANTVADTNKKYSDGTTTAKGSATAQEILQDYINAGLTPAQAAMKMAALYENTGTQVTPTMIDGWTTQAKGMSKTSPITTESVAPKILPTGPSPAAGQDLNTRYENLYNQYSSGSGGFYIEQTERLIREQLIKEGYSAAAVNSLPKHSYIGKLVQTVENSFFGSLFK